MELHLPEQAPPARGDKFKSARRTRRWLEDLQAGPDREIAARFIEGLQHFNRIGMRTGRRLKTAEQLRPTARHLVGRFVQRISTQSLPLDETSRRNFQSLLSMLRELSLAYDIVAQTLGSARRPSRRRLTLAIERALWYRGETMLRSAPVHAPLPQNFWHDANTLYGLAESHRCARRRVRNDELVTARRRRQSPAEMYTRLLLFGLAPTDGLRRGQADRLYRRMETWCRLARFPAVKTDDASVVYHVDLEQPHGPRPGRPDEAGSFELGGDSVRLLDLGPVLAAAQKALPQAPPEDAVLEGDQVDAAALQRLIDSWSGRGQRASERKARSEPADVETTLGRIQKRLIADTAIAEPETGYDRSRPLGNIATLALQTIDQSDHEWQRSGKRRVKTRDMPGAWSDSQETRAVPVAPSHATPETARGWSLVDTSRTGFRLRWDGSGSSPANVGELVALHEQLQGTEDPEKPRERWVVGVIRRVRMIDDARFDAGVETLGQYPAPAVVRREPANPHRKRDRGNEPSEPALMLPALKRLEIPATLVVPAHMFHEGETLELDMHERVLRIELGPVRHSSAAFTRFDMAPAPPRGKRSTARAPDGGGAP